MESSAATKKERKYDTEFKLKVTKYAEKFSNRMAAGNFSVGESCIRDWRKNKSMLQQMPGKSLCLPGGGRKPCAPDMEKALADWIKNNQ